MSTSDLMQTDADAIADPYTTAMARHQKISASESLDGLDSYKPGQYLQTSDISDYKVDS